MVELIRWRGVGGRFVNIDPIVVVAVCMTNIHVLCTYVFGMCLLKIPEESERVVNKVGVSVVFEGQNMRTTSIGCQITSASNIRFRFIR